MKLKRQRLVVEMVNGVQMRAMRKKCEWHAHSSLVFASPSMEVPVAAASACCATTVTGSLLEGDRQVSEWLHALPVSDK